MNLNEVNKYINNLNKKLFIQRFKTDQTTLLCIQGNLGKKDHPTADEILVRVEKNFLFLLLPFTICLETLVDCALVKQVNMDRSPSRYCPNLTPHAHFKCSTTGKIVDLNLTESDITKLNSMLPDGYQAENFDLTFFQFFGPHCPTKYISEPHSK